MVEVLVLIMIISKGFYTSQASASVFLFDRNVKNSNLMLSYKLNI